MALVEVAVTVPSFEAIDRLETQKASIYRNAGQYLARCIRNHMRLLARSRHSSSTKLGAKPSNHFKATDVLDPVITENGATVAVTTPGISRAYHDIDIYPKEASALAIPLHASAYGMSPREVNDRGTYKLFRIKRKGTNQKGNVLYRQDGDSLIPMYALTAHVHQVQDPTLMPSSDDMLEEARKGAEEAIRQILGNLGK